MTINIPFRPCKSSDAEIGLFITGGHIGFYFGRFAIIKYKENKHFKYFKYFATGTGG